MYPAYLMIDNLIIIMMHWIVNIIDEILIPGYTRCCQHNHLPVQSVMKLLSKWQQFLFTVQDCTQSYLAHAQWKICGIHFVKCVEDVYYFLHNYWNYISAGHLITMVSHEYHCISNHQSFNCLFNSLFRLKTKGIPKLLITHSPHKVLSDAGNGSMSWYHTLNDWVIYSYFITFFHIQFRSMNHWPSFMTRLCNCGVCCMVFIILKSFIAEFMFTHWYHGDAAVIIN